AIDTEALNRQRMAKLPAWARARIGRLEMELAAAQQDAAAAMCQAEEGAPGAKIFMENGSVHPRKSVPLNKYAHVVFVTGPGPREYLRARVTTVAGQDWVELRTGEGTMLQRGDSYSNGVLLRPDPYWLIAPPFD